jgi:hypothetical protein
LRMVSLDIKYLKLRQDLKADQDQSLKDGSLF